MAYMVYLGALEKLETDSWKNLKFKISRETSFKFGKFPSVRGSFPCLNKAFLFFSEKTCGYS